MSLYRNELKNSPYRNRSVEENLKLFNYMRQGRFAEGTCTLRVKMDMQNENPNMRDFVAYRIRYVEHPMAGDKWCIYPTYDYTHCIVDSLENITHSLCTLEFEIRRESYYQLLKDIDIYKPYVWEYSRLNISNTILSKRKIEEIVNKGIVNGWKDPRLFTIEGLRKRGYTPSMINDFCAHVGVSRKGNENLTSYKLLEKFARTELDREAPRVFGVMNPVLLEITNLEAATSTKFEAPLFPADPTKGIRTYTMTKNVYIDAEDFSEEHIDKFFGLTSKQPVCLKYGPVVKLIEVVRNADGSISHAKVEILPDFKEKLKGYIHWVSKEHSIDAVCNLYSVLFLVEDIKKAGDKWLDFVNPKSLVV
jgi:glutaminyl-tRNA synthetase